MQPVMMLHSDLHRRLVESLYSEAMLLADEARAYFEQRGDQDRESLELSARIVFSCESLKVTTRLMQVIAWLMTQRGWHRAEVETAELNDPLNHLGPAATTDMASVAGFPFGARALIEASMDLYARAARLQARMGLGASPAAPQPAESPARALLHRLERAL